MIQLYVDIVTNKITGYNCVVSSDYSRDSILVEDTELEKLKDFLIKEFYFVDGEIIEGNDAIKDVYSIQLNNINQQLLELQAKVDKEYTIFLDNIISGMDMQQAASISEQNRAALEEIKNQKTELENAHGEEIKRAAVNLMEQEEQGIDFKHFLSMVTIVRDENDYLEEWIRYHIEDMGFDHFYIYDNESAVPVKEYLENAGFPYMEQITVINWPTSGNSQKDSHNDFLKNYSLETKWFLAADPDEYIVIHSSDRTLKQFLSENGHYSTIQCLWKCFNANGHVEQSKETDMVRFTQEVEWDYGKNKGKYFAQSNRVERFTNYTPSARHDTKTLTFLDDSVKEFFQLNHYYTRSYEEWIRKIERGTAVPYAKRKFAEFFELNPELVYLNAGRSEEQKYGSVERKSESEKRR